MLIYKTMENETFSHIIETKKSSRLIFAGFALVLAVLSEIFLWDIQPGLGFALFVLIYVLGFLAISVSIKQLKNKLSLLLLIPISIMSIDILLLNNSLVQTGVPLFVLILLFLFSVFSTLKNPHSHLFSFAKIPVVRNVFIVLNKLKHLKNDVLNFKKVSNTDVTKKIIKGIAISLPILFLFALLFANADAVFSDLMVRIFNFDIDVDKGWRVIRTVTVALLLSGFFYVLIGKKHKLGEKIADAMKLDRITTITVLALINGLFLLFVFIQVQYLFGNAEFISENGITFANYARSGFFELAWVIVLASFILGAIYKSFSHHGESKAVTVLQVLLIFQVAVIAFSALKRMNLYQDAYGYTILRLYVEWFIYLTIVLTLIGAASLIASLEFRKYFYLSLVIGLTALTAVSSINVDRVIAEQNIQKFIESKSVVYSDAIDFNSTIFDLNYLGTLSVDATLAFDMLKDVDLTYKQKLRVENIIEAKLRELRKESSIFAYNFNRAKAMDKLSSLKTYFEYKEPEKTKETYEPEE